MIVNENPDISQYQDHIGLTVRNEHLCPIGDIVDFGVAETDHFGGKHVFAILDTGYKVYVRDIPALNKIVEIV